MSISQYIKEIGRGKRGAKPLDRAQAEDLMGQILDGKVTDLEVGAFCIAMRVKGESTEEMAGFLDAIHARLNLLPTSATPAVVLPSYNGARRLPILTPLLALLLARQGLPVLIHGTVTEPGSKRVPVADVLETLMHKALEHIEAIEPGRVAFATTELLSPALKRLLDVRQVIGLRNPAHSLVKLMNPFAGRALVIGSYTHAEYAQSMAATYALTGADALLLRGTEGEAVADPRRMPAMEGFVAGKRIELEPAPEEPRIKVPELPQSIDAQSTADYIRAVLDADIPVPEPISRQIQHIEDLIGQMSSR